MKKEMNEINQLLLLFVILIFLFLAAVSYSLYQTTVELNQLKTRVKLNEPQIKIVSKPTLSSQPLHLQNNK